MQFALVFISIFVVCYIGYKMFGTKSVPVFERAMAHTRRGESIRAEFIMERGLEEIEAKHGPDALETVEAKAGLGIILSRVGEAQRAGKLLDETRKTLIEKKSSMIPVAMAHRAMLQKGTAATLPAFLGVLDDLDLETKQAILHESALLATEVPPDMGLAFLKDVRVKAEQLQDEQLLKEIAAANKVVSERQEAMTKALAALQAQQVAAEAAQAAQGDEGGGHGGHSCGPGGCATCGH